LFISHYWLYTVPSSWSLVSDLVKTGYCPEAFCLTFSSGRWQEGQGSSLGLGQVTWCMDGCFLTLLCADHHIWSQGERELTGG
jgi:hypothetical protein